MEGRIVGQLLYKLHAHPTNPVYVMRMVYNDTCFSSDYEQCSIQCQVSPFQGADNTWTTINNYTFSASWGAEESQIYLISMEPSQQPANQLSVSPLDPGHKMVIFDQYGGRVLRQVPNVMTFRFINGVVYFAKILPNGSVKTYLSTDTDSASEIIYNGSANYTALIFEVLESTPEISFVAIRTSRNVEFGSLYQSVSADAHYWMSLPFIRMNGNGAEFYATKGAPSHPLPN